MWNRCGLEQQTAGRRWLCRYVSACGDQRRTGRAGSLARSAVRRPRLHDTFPPLGRSRRAHGLVFQEARFAERTCALGLVRAAPRLPARLPAAGLDAFQSRFDDDDDDSDSPRCVGPVDQDEDEEEVRRGQTRLAQTSQAVQALSKRRRRRRR